MSTRLNIQDKLQGKKLLKAAKKLGLRQPGFSIRGAVRALRQDGSDVVQLLNEITDDALAAGAKLIEITTSCAGGDGTKKLQTIVHADTGLGFIDAADLNRFPDFYSSEAHLNDKIVSHYGIGALKALLAMAKTFVIASRCQDGVIRGITVNVPQLENGGGFWDTTTEAPGGLSYDDIWNEHSCDPSKSGTVFFLTELTLKTHQTKGSLDEALLRPTTLRKRYYEPLSNGTIIKVNRKLLAAYDPVGRHLKDTQVLLQQNITLGGAFGELILTALSPTDAKNDGVRNSGMSVMLNGVVIALSTNWLDTVEGNVSWLTHLRGMIIFRSKSECMKVLEFTPDKSRVTVINPQFTKDLDASLSGPRNSHIAARKATNQATTAAQFNATLAQEDLEFYNTALGNLMTTPTPKLSAEVAKIKGFAPGSGFASAADPGRISAANVMEYNKGWAPISQRIKSDSADTRRQARAIVSVAILEQHLPISVHLDMIETTTYINNLMKA